MAATPIELAGYRVRTVRTGTFRLDGGAMFGSVPRVLWERKAPPDERNRIELATRSLWIEEISGQRRVLVDLGNGEKFDDRGREMFRIENVDPARWGVPLHELTDIVLTHLHFDHAGGVSQHGRHDEAGTLELTFPGATVHVQRENLQNARTPNEKERGGYRAENVEPLAAAELRLLEGDGPLFPGIDVTVFNGHTRGLQGICIGSGNGTVAFPSDLIPTASHLHLPWIMGYDRCAETTLQEKRRFLERAVEERWVVVFGHDPQIAAATIGRDARGRFAVDEIVTL